MPPLTRPPLTRVRVPSPIGPLVLSGDDAHVHEVLLPPSAGDHDIDNSLGLGELPEDAARVTAAHGSGPLTAAHAQLGAYFAGELRTFELPLALDGPPFFVEVWRAVCAIPFGETRTYGDVAAELGRPRAARAVGLANGRNPLPILVPCHRLIGADGSLTGYGGGLECKRWLLDREARLAADA
jgi:methylated-DNA-[protein]-cysteine S-methyltransferase